MKLISNKEDAIIASAILAEAYADAPNLNWMFALNHKNFSCFFRVLVEDAINKNGAYLTSNNNGVLLLYNLKAHSFTLINLFRKIYLILFVIGLKKSVQLIKLNKIKRQHRPQTGLYGAVLGLKKGQYTWQTRHELKSDFLKLVERANMPVYIETTNPRIYLLYKSLSFTEYHQMKHPYADLSIYFMKLTVSK
ncbi:hypothetical protein [Carboxylicivirga sp. M1479]|uniref:hypothetical protein n=1 Tax=Carboxylicivirga sp. M1479 TaxID=2594476 RepID=UPI001177DF65|nr:hypothetical protein [Carboxylicivirga sp. M1479]TRX70482.1 hypothetical protein FNN09_10920 [Carboxylicivirga sp. M1479]